MQISVLVQNIEQMRQREGIDDVELRREIRTMKIGDCVRLTLVSELKHAGSETVVVRITKIDGANFRGSLLSKPTTKGLNSLPADLSLDFKGEHIHSLEKNGDSDSHRALVD